MSMKYSNNGTEFYFVWCRFKSHVSKHL